MGSIFASYYTQQNHTYFTNTPNTPNTSQWVSSAKQPSSVPATTPTSTIKTRSAPSVARSTLHNKRGTLQRITTATARASSNIRSSRTAIHHMPALTGRASMPLAQSTRLANEEHWNGGVLEY